MVGSADLAVDFVAVFRVDFGPLGDCAGECLASSGRASILTAGGRLGSKRVRPVGLGLRVNSFVTIFLRGDCIIFSNWG